MAACCHPLEFLVGNVAPLLAGTLLLRAHATSAALWALTVVCGTQVHHSGVAWLWMAADLQPQCHDAHHERFAANFGTHGVLGALHGTGE